MRVRDVAALESRRVLSAWTRDVTVYSVDMLNELDPKEELFPKTEEKRPLNARSWHAYS